MPAGHGTRARTRDSFSRPFRGKGYIPLSVYLRTYKIGDYVDIKVNSAVMKVMHCWAANIAWKRPKSVHAPGSTPLERNDRISSEGAWGGWDCRVCLTRCTTAEQASCGISPSAPWAWR